MTDPTDSSVPRHDSEPAVAPAPASGSIAPQRSLPERIFLGTYGLRVGWRLLLYFALAAAIVFALNWLGDSIFRNPHGAARLWDEFFGECALLLGAFVPALFLARIEHRPFDDYGLPRTQAFGRLFWIGAVWGFASITALLLLLRGARVYEFGALALHGVRIVRFALFWGVYFVIVGLFEEFLMRGYLLFTLASRIRFWPAAVILSVLFGAIHLSNRGETFIGALGAALIGLFFCLTLRRTGSLWFAVGFHAAWDWGETYFYGVPDSGTVEPGHLLTPSLHGQPWLSGGTVGPEASVLLLVVMAAVWWLFHRQYREARYLAQA